VCRFGVRERSSLASDNNVTCTVAENVTNKQTNKKSDRKTVSDMQKKKIQTKLLQQTDPRKGGNVCLRTFGADLSILLKRRCLNKQANAATRLTSHFRRE